LLWASSHASTRRAALLLGLLLGLVVVVVVAALSTKKLLLLPLYMGPGCVDAVLVGLSDGLGRGISN
jgi:hypothetical protein